MTVDRSPARPEDVIRDALDALVGLLQQAEQELREKRALLASDDPAAALARERLSAFADRERLEARLAEREAEWKEAWKMRMEQYHAAVARAERAEQALREIEAMPYAFGAAKKARDALAALDAQPAELSEPDGDVAPAPSVGRAPSGSLSPSQPAEEKPEHWADTKRWARRWARNEKP